MLSITLESEIDCSAEIVFVMLLEQISYFLYQQVVLTGMLLVYDATFILPKLWVRSSHVKLENENVTYYMLVLKLVFSFCCQHAVCDPKVCFLSGVCFFFFKRVANLKLQILFSSGEISNTMKALNKVFVSLKYAFPVSFKLSKCGSWSQQNKYFTQICSSWWL